MQQTWLICVSEIDFIMHARAYVRCVVCVALLMWAFFFVWFGHACCLFLFVCLLLSLHVAFFFCYVHMC